MRIFAALTGLIGELVARGTSEACFWGFLDEEECPKSLLK